MIGLLDITHAADFVTISWNTFADHWKALLFGHSDNNAAEDTGKLRKPLS
jgi:pectate lyase